MKKLLVVDKLEYKERHEEFLNILNINNNTSSNDIFYTSYEDSMIRRVRNLKVIGSPMQHMLYWGKSFKYAIKILRSDAIQIYCLNPIVAIFLGLFNRRKKIVMGGFLFEPKKSKLYYTLRKYIVKISMRGISRIVVYGKNEVEYYKAIFNNENEKFVFIPYGIDFDSTTRYDKQKLPTKYFFSGGGSNRDYETLIDSYNKMKINRMPLVIATQPWQVNKFDISQIQVLTDVVIENFGYVLKKATLLILSLKNEQISAGHMVMFQAMSEGIPIIVNDIPAVKDYVNEGMVTFYKSGDTDELKKILENFKANRNLYICKSKLAKEKYEKELRLLPFIDRFIAL